MANDLTLLNAFAKTLKRVMPDLAKKVEQGLRAIKENSIVPVGNGEEAMALDVFLSALDPPRAQSGKLIAAFSGLNLVEAGSLAHGVIEIYDCDGVLKTTHFGVGSVRIGTKQ